MSDLFNLTETGSLLTFYKALYRSARSRLLVFPSPFFCLLGPSHPDFFGSSQTGVIGGQIWNPIPFSRVGAQTSSYTNLGSLVLY